MEKTTISMTSRIDIIEALAILDMLMGDEWAAITAEYAQDHADEAIQVIEDAGLFSSLPGRYGRFRQQYVWG